MCCHIEFAKTKCRPTECVFPTHLTERLQATTTSRVGQTGTGRGGGGVKGEQAHALDFNGFERHKQISVCAIGVCVCAYVDACVCVVCGIERDKEQSSRATQVQARVQPRSGKHKVQVAAK